jgi:hypothetical protein
MKCKNCGSIEELESIQKEGYVSCCPERDTIEDKELLDKLLLAVKSFTRINDSVGNRLVRHSISEHLTAIHIILKKAK